MAEIARVLEELGLFEGVSPATVAAIARGTRMLRPRRGALLHRMGDGASELFAVVDGAVALTLGDEPGAPEVARVERRGGVFGWEALVDAGPERTSSARATCDSVLLAIGGTVAREALKMSGEPGIRALDRLSAAGSSYLMEVSRLLAREVARRRGVGEAAGTGIDRARLGEIIVSFLRPFINVQPDQVDSRIVDSLKLLAGFFQAGTASLVRVRGQQEPADSNPPARLLFGWDRAADASRPPAPVADLDAIGWQRLQSGETAMADDPQGGNALRVPAAQRGEVVGYLELTGVSAAMAGDRNCARLLALAGEALLSALAHQEVEKALRTLAQFDALTGLANRTLLLDRMEGALARARRGKTSVAVLFVDLDRFKTVNDRFGHEAGDTVLKEVAKRMRACVRETDTVARLGGDEFIVLLEGLKARQDAEPTAGRCLEAMRLPIRWGADGRDVAISASIGIALYPEAAEDREGLIRSADAGMYEAKRHGGAAFRHYSDVKVA